jgi:hypothetical protein
MIGTRRFWFWRRAALRRLQRSYLAPVIALGALVLAPTSLAAQDAPEPGEQGAAPASDCADAPDHRRLTEALRRVVAPGDPEPNGGWATTCGRWR